MKLVLDEHYSFVIAEQLQKRGHDVIPVAERMDAARAPLRRSPDEELLHWARQHGRVVVTENVKDFARIHGEFLLCGEVHSGIILVPSRKFPRDRESPGPIIEALAAFVDANTERSMENTLVWL